jgi:hypothetical protein
VSERNESRGLGNRVELMNLIKFEACSRPSWLPISGMDTSAAKPSEADTVEDTTGACVDLKKA